MLRRRLILAAVVLAVATVATCSGLSEHFATVVGVLGTLAVVGAWLAAFRVQRRPARTVYDLLPAEGRIVVRAVVTDLPLEIGAGS